VYEHANQIAFFLLNTNSLCNLIVFFTCTKLPIYTERHKYTYHVSYLMKQVLHTNNFKVLHTYNKFSHGYVLECIVWK